MGDLARFVPLQPHMRAIPRTMAVKFPTEFMLPWRWLIRLRGVLPWNRRRWAHLIMVTLPGAEVKGSKLLKGARLSIARGAG